MKLKTLSTVCFAAAACWFVCSVTAAATSHYVYYSKYNQEQTNWCWVACAQMSGKQAYSASNLTQSQVVTYVKGAPVNQPASLEETRIAAQRFTNNTVNYTSSENNLMYEFLVAQVMYSKVPVCGWSVYDPPYADPVSGHMVTVSGVEYGSTPDSRYVTYFDPAYQVDAIRISFSDFMTRSAGGDCFYKWNGNVYRY